MQSLKLLGLAAMAAAALTVAGTGTASATVLCTATDTPVCEGTHKYGVGTVFDFSLKAGTSFKVWGDPRGESQLFTCTESTIKGKIGNAGGATSTVSGAIEQWTWNGCSTTVETISLGELEFHYIGTTHNGTVTGKNTDVTASIFGVSCTYGTGAGIDWGTLTGGSEPVLTISVTINKTAGGFLCPEHMIWEAEYVLTEPHAAFVTES